MSNRLFSATGAIRHCGPKRVKRTWCGTVCSVLMLLALAALTGWLLHCVKHATLPTPVRLPGVAMAPVTQGMVMGALLSLSAMGIVLAVRKMVRKMARNDQEVLSGGRWKDELDARVKHEAAKRRSEDPLQLPYMGMSTDDLQRIFAALIFEVSEAQDMVSKANANCSVEDYGDRLTGAERRLYGAVLCLGRLLDLSGKQGGAADGFPRGYAAPAAAHRPNHGGYAS